jgi:hypothetical protein
VTTPSRRYPSRIHSRNRTLREEYRKVGYTAQLPSGVILTLKVRTLGDDFSCDGQNHGAASLVAESSSVASKGHFGDHTAAGTSISMGVPSSDRLDATTKAPRSSVHCHSRLKRCVQPSLNDSPSSNSARKPLRGTRCKRATKSSERAFRRAMYAGNRIRFRAYRSPAISAVAAGPVTSTEAILFTPLTSSKWLLHQCLLIQRNRGVQLESPLLADITSISLLPRQPKEHSDAKRRFSTTVRVHAYGS